MALDFGIASGDDLCSSQIKLGSRNQMMHAFFSTQQSILSMKSFPFPNPQIHPIPPFESRFLTPEVLINSRSSPTLLVPAQFVLPIRR